MSLKTIPERLVPVKLPPGLSANGTVYQNKNRWYDASLARWHEGMIMPVGGWKNVLLTTTTWPTATPVSINKLIVDTNGNVQAVTHAGTTGGSAPAWSTVVGTGTNDNGVNWVNLGPNGAAVRTVPGVSGLWSPVTTFDLNVNIVDTNGNVQQITTAGTTGATAPAWSQTVGATTADNTAVWTNRGKPGNPRGAFAYSSDAGVRRLAIGTPLKAFDYSDGVLTDITPAGFTSGGADGGFATGAYGSGLFGMGPYGSGTGGVTLIAAASWHFDNFGQILIACFPADGRILQSTNGSTMTVVDATAPTQCVGVVVTPERFIVALGGQISGGSSVDSRYISWASQGTLTIWPTASTPTSVADSRGSWKLQSRGRLIAGRRTRTETLLWTDSELFTMTFVGAPLYYSVQQRGAGCGLIAPNAIATVVDVAYWMGLSKFHLYNGVVSDIPCEVLDKVFSLSGNLQSATQMDPTQASKTFCHTNTTFHEITWYYASMVRAAGTEPDRYVTYNYQENHWTLGALNRSAGVDRDVYTYPMLLDTTGYLFEHEVGVAMPGVASGSPYPLPYLVSGPIEFASAYGPYMTPTPGDVVFRLERFLPDEKALGDLQTTVFVANNPTDAEVALGPFVHAAPTTFRVTGRQMRLKHEQVRSTSWRLGVNRIGLIPGGLR